MINTVTAAEKNPKDFPGETTRFGPLLRPAAADFIGNACRAKARRRACGPPAEKEFFSFSTALTIWPKCPASGVLGREGSPAPFGGGRVPAPRLRGRRERRMFFIRFCPPGEHFKNPVKSYRYCYSNCKC